ncbi:hypothetical protein BV898_00410 [Hypsibius exemplaris]|uniref:Amine oxidase domain-containing protein n=1 Tax=Hypsibius exemplaris TaxID=2072580 RepID=A0A1W0XDB4_HYPEX|nr:hypothetical protein BV898_00410 [Hypsibius exemplaris]
MVQLQKEALRFKAATVFFVLFVVIFLATSVALLAYLVIEQIEGASTSLKEPISKQHITCDVLIIGSGFAGSFAAYQLAPQVKDKLCLIEKSDRDGGRIYDVSEYPGGPVFGAGALRVTGKQTTMLALAKELGMTLQTVEDEQELLKVRGRHYYRGGPTLLEGEAARGMCRDVFPSANCSNDSSAPTDERMFSILSRLREERPHLIDAHPDFPTLLHSLFGDEGVAFFEANSYHSLVSSISNQAALDFIESEEGTFGALSYPLGGMSQYIIRMLERAITDGLRLFRSEPAVSIESRADGTFVVETTTLSITADRVLCAVDPLGFAGISGNVAERVKASPEFQAILPKTSITVAAWWDARWWEQSVLHRNRNLTRITSHGNCFNGMEVAVFPYGRDQNVTRVVYDDGACLDTWRLLINAGASSEKLTNEVLRSLQQVFHDVKVPRPRSLIGYVHENAWHFQHPKSKKSNKEILNWSMRPTSYDHFSLIGEAYNLNLSGWADAALKSTMAVMMKYYNVTYPCLNEPSSPAYCPLGSSQFSRKPAEPRQIRLRLP